MTNAAIPAPAAAVKLLGGTKSGEPAVALVVGLTPLGVIGDGDGGGTLSLAEIPAAEEVGPAKEAASPLGDGEDVAVTVAVSVV